MFSADVPIHCDTDCMSIVALSNVYVSQNYWRSKIQARYLVYLEINYDFAFRVSLLGHEWRAPSL